MKRKNRVVSTAALFCWSVTSAAANVTLYTDGEPRATIVLGANAAETEKLAVTELNNILTNIAGAPLPVATDDAAPEVHLDARLRAGEPHWALAFRAHAKAPLLDGFFAV